MPWKTREDGTIEIENGNPVYVHPDGKEVPFDADGALRSISNFIKESKVSKKQISDLTERLSSFESIGDPAEAMKAIETIKNLDAKKLVDAGQIDILKNEMSRTFTEKESDLRKQWQTKEQEYQDSLRKKEESIYSLMLNGKFSSSPFISEKTLLPPDVASTFFGKHFKVEGEGTDARIVGYLNGERIPSRERFGEPADFEEALVTIVDAYPHKDRILKTGMAGGSGSTGNKMPTSSAKVQYIAADDKKAFGENLERIARGEVQIAR